MYLWIQITLNYVWKALGYYIASVCLYQQVMEEVVKLLAPINTTKLETHGEGTDISQWMQAGVPGQFKQYVCLSATSSKVSLQETLKIHTKIHTKFKKKCYIWFNMIFFNLSQI